MTRATANDKEIVVEILAASFDTNLSVNYIVKQDARRKDRIRELMRYSFELCRLFGEVLLTEDKKACALLIYPDKKAVTLRAVLLDARLVLKCVGLRNLRKTMAREALLKQVRGSEPMTNLWFIGVHPSHQHQGHGSLLLKKVIDQSKQMNRPIYLETSNTNNLPWYTKFGFEIYAERDLGHTLYFLKM